METLGSLRRTNYCGEVSMSNVGQEMTVCGSIARARDKGGIIFADLRDTTGILQLVFDEDTPKEVFAKAESLKSEYVVICRGKLRERAAKTDKIATGDVELYVAELRILSEAQTTPFELRDEINVNDDLRLRYRYLDLRRPSMHEPIVLRSKIMQIIRNYFCENHFTEIETPTLIKSTPEGARDYLVPSRVQPGHFYALPQSPQLYKQILMLSGFDRYFQIARCYRDEDLRADRQPEFTQVDMDGKSYAGRAYFDRADALVRQGYFARWGTPERDRGLDFMWYLWCGPNSPLFGKDRMTTFERYFVSDCSAWEEVKNPYYDLVVEYPAAAAILREFGLNERSAHIINGHVPVRAAKGEHPVRADGRYIRIDGGFCRAYHDRTGIAGYTLIYSSRGLRLVSHSPFGGKDAAIRENRDILASSDVVFEMMPHRMLVRDTDEGAALLDRMSDLRALLDAYREGVVSPD